jgi:hypothetical protein
LKKNIIPKKKSIGSAIGANGPTFCNHWNNMQRIIQIYQPVVQHIAHPSCRLPRSVCRIKRLNPNRLVVTKDFLVGFCRKGKGKK